MDPLSDDYLDALLGQTMSRHLFQPCQRVPTLLIVTEQNDLQDVNWNKKKGIDSRVVISKYFYSKEI